MKREQQRDICFNERQKVGNTGIDQKSQYNAGWEDADKTNLQGWHPGTEKPVLYKGEDDVEFITLVRFKDGTMLPFRATYCPVTGWSHDNVEWWIATPKKIKLIS